MSIAAVFNSDDSFATCLVTGLIDQYGAESLNWDMATIRLELKDDLKVDLSPINSDKLQAILTALTTDHFFNTPFIFGHICEALDGVATDFEYLPDPSPEQAAWGITEVALVWGKERPEFDPTVRRYLGAILDTHGLYHPPDVLKLADYPSHVDSGNLAGDPDLHEEHTRRNQQDAADITAHIKLRMKALISQLDRLPLKNRDAESWRVFMHRFAQLPR